jgi:hypothetical protein
MEANAKPPLTTDAALCDADKTVGGIRQGNYGDCHFVSSMVDVANQPGGVDKLKNMIQPAPGADWVGKRTTDGQPDQKDPEGHWDKYQVKFPGAEKAVTVSWNNNVRNTEAAFDNFNAGHLSGGQNSRYPAILEAAAGRVFGDNKWGSSQKDKFVDNTKDPTHNLEYAPGGAAHSLKLLTNQDADIYHTANGLTQTQIVERNAEVAKLQENSLSGLLYRDGNALGLCGKDANAPIPGSPDATAFVQKMKASIDHGGAVTAVAGEHAYSVLGVNSDKTGNEYVVLRNPQHQNMPNKDEAGNDFLPACKQDANLNALMPVKQFMTTFSEVYEASKPAS